jgi:putative hydrolase of HD superfamily
VSDCESVSEHSFHLALLVFSIAQQTEGVCALRAVAMALIHDLAEVRTGDLPRTAARFFPDGAKKAAERAILEDLLAPLGDQALELFDEYSKRETSESQLVRACDELQLLIKVASYRRAGNGELEDLWRLRESFDDRGFPAVRKIVDSLA